LCPGWLERGIAVLPGGHLVCAHVAGAMAHLVKRCQLRHWHKYSCNVGMSLPQTSLTACRGGGCSTRGGHSPTKSCVCPPPAFPRTFCIWLPLTFIKHQKFCAHTPDDCSFLFWQLQDALDACAFEAQVVLARTTLCVLHSTSCRHLSRAPAVAGTWLICNKYAALRHPQHIKAHETARS
jgi:hypothetical protein